MSIAPDQASPRPLVPNRWCPGELGPSSSSRRWDSIAGCGGVGGGGLAGGCLDPCPAPGCLPACAGSLEPCPAPGCLPPCAGLPPFDGEGGVVTVDTAGAAEGVAAGTAG